MAAESLPALPCACANLRRAARAVTRGYEAALKGTGLTPTQHTLLQALDLLGLSPQGALGELLAIDSTTLTRTLRPLERAGSAPDAARRRGVGEARGRSGSGSRGGEGVVKTMDPAHHRWHNVAVCLSPCRVRFKERSNS